MAYEDIQTPCLILDLDALERNVKKMGDYARAHNMRHRAHGKMHKSVDVLKLQMELGGAIGVCCQKVSEAEVFARAGIKDILVSNQVRDPAKIDRLARLPKISAARIIVCVDDVANVADLSAAAQKHGTTIERLRRDRLRRRPLRRDHHRGRGRDRQGRRRRARPAASSASRPTRAPCSTSTSYEDRKAKLDAAIAQVKDAVEALEEGRPRARARLRRRHRQLLLRSRTPASTTSSSAAATPSWTPTTAASTTRTASASTRASGRTRSSS